MNQDFIPENSASELAGVSAHTLSRFVEAGYLRVQNDQQGLKNYSKSEICKLFAIDPVAPENDSYLRNAIEVKDEAVTEITEEPEKIYWADTVSPPESAPEEISPEEINEAKSETSFNEDSYKDKAEITRLRNITMMQDKILEMRESEIEDLRKEREWLKTRVEKLEEKSERDQILLLAETQTLKRLVSMTFQKKPSNFRLALEWFGLVPAQSEQKEIQINNSKIIE